MDFIPTAPSLFTRLIVLGLSSISGNAFAAKDPYFHIPLYQFANQATLSLDIHSADKTQSLVVYSSDGHALSEPTSPSITPLGITSDDRDSPRLASFRSLFSFKFPFWRSRSLISLGGSSQDIFSTNIDGRDFATIKKNSYAVVLTKSDADQQLEIFHQSGKHLSIPLSQLSDTFQKFFSHPVSCARKYDLKLSGAIHAFGQDGLVLMLVDRAAEDGLLHLESIFISGTDGAIHKLRDRKFNRNATVDSLRFDSSNGNIGITFDYTRPRAKKHELIHLSLMTCDDIATNNEISPI